MASRRPSPVSRRTVAIKRVDGEPLTRADIQYDVLRGIFDDKHQVFTDPYSSSSSTSESTKICFRDLYIKSILNSPKVTKALKDKMTESSLFAEDFSMLALLVNVGRINTTMSFFAEMKTAIRTYHPIPALQRSNGNLQDAPRIKHVLKTSLLEDEQKAAPTTPPDILSRVRAGKIPSTSAMNLLFVLAQHSGPVGQAHFSEDIDFIDLFLRADVSSASRARAFLWLCFRYLEDPSTTDDDDDYDNNTIANPFADPRKGKLPSFSFLTQDEVELENVDSTEEEALAKKLIAQRNQVVRLQTIKEGTKGSNKASASGSVVEEEDLARSNDEAKPIKGKRKSGLIEKAKGTVSASAKGKKSTSNKAPKESAKQRTRMHELSFVAQVEHSDDDYDHAVPSTSSRHPSIQENQYPAFHSQHSIAEPQPSLHRSGQLPYRRISSRSPEPLNRSRRHRYSPYTTRSSIPETLTGSKDTRRVYSARAPVAMPQRSMLQHAWHIIHTTDPLMDSDEEMADEHVRQDYIQRLKIISRLRGKAPTPEL